jgi:hypothetical protein
MAMAAALAPRSSYFYRHGDETPGYPHVDPNKVDIEPADVEMFIRWFSAYTRVMQMADEYLVAQGNTTPTNKERRGAMHQFTWSPNLAIGRCLDAGQLCVADGISLCTDHMEKNFKCWPMGPLSVLLSPPDPTVLHVVPFQLDVPCFQYYKQHMFYNSKLVEAAQKLKEAEARMAAQKLKEAELEETVQKLKEAGMAAQKLKEAKLEETVQKLKEAEVEMVAQKLKEAKLEETVQKLKEVEMVALKLKEAELEETVQKLKEAEAEMVVQKLKEAELEETVQKLKEAEVEMVAQKLKEAEMAAQKLKEAEMAAQKLKEAELEETVQKLKEAEVEMVAQKLKEAEMVAQKLKEAEMAAQKLKEAEMAAQKLKEAELEETVQKLKEAEVEMVAQKLKEAELEETVRKLKEAETEVEQAMAVMDAANQQLTITDVLRTEVEVLRQMEQTLRAEKEELAIKLGARPQSNTDQADTAALMAWKIKAEKDVAVHRATAEQALARKEEMEINLLEAQARLKDAIAERDTAQAEVDNLKGLLSKSREAAAASQEQLEQSLEKAMEDNNRSRLTLQRRGTKRSSRKMEARVMNDCELTDDEKKQQLSWTPVKLCDQRTKKRLPDERSVHDGCRSARP